MNETPINIFLTSFDWDNLAEKKPEQIIAKLNRDKLYPKKNHFLILSWGPGKYEKEIAPNIRVIRRSARLRFFRPLYDVLTYWIAPSLVQRSGFKPDLLLAYDFPFIMALSRAKRILNAPLVLCLTNLPRHYINSRNSLRLPKLGYQIIVERLATKHISLVYTINDAIRKYALNCGVPDSSISVYTMDTISPDLDTVAHVKGGFLRSRYPIPHNHKIFFAAARLEGEKGLDRLIKAVAELKRQDVTLVIAGRGPLESELKELAHKLGLRDRVIFLGHVSREDVWSSLVDTDIFILLSRAEGLGLVFWEAMYLNKPVIGSRADGIVETIGEKEERGFLWEPEDGMEVLEKYVTTCLSGGAEDKVKRAKIYVDTKLGNDMGIAKAYKLCEDR
jgi:glycosyltransferase involved in cell wall biosynthesis